MSSALPLTPAFCAWLRQHRKESSLVQVAQRYGCSKSAWQRYESGRRALPFTLYARLATAHTDLPPLALPEGLGPTVLPGARDLPALMQWLAGMPADQALALLDDAAQAINQQRTFMPVQAITFTEAA